MKASEMRHTGLQVRQPLASVRADKPANVVVPIDGIFIVGGSLLGVLFLGEPMAWHKSLGSPPPSSAWCSSRFSEARVAEGMLRRSTTPGFWSSMAQQNRSGQKRSGGCIHVGERREAVGTPR